MSKSTAALLGVVSLLVFIPCVASHGEDALATGQDGYITASLYEKQATLQETLPAIRPKYQAWLIKQRSVRQDVQLGPWLATPAMPAGELEKQIRPDVGFNLKATTAKGKRLWTPQNDLPDGKIATLPAAPRGMAVYLTRTINAKRPVRLTVGIGGGDRLGVWLNGQQATTADTHLTSGRYGCSHRVDGTRVDQLIVDLDLRAGKNVLVVRVTLAEEPSFYFSPSPNPVPRFWEQIRKDFPTAENPLLALVNAEWFSTTKGWFSQRDTMLEQQLLDVLAADCGKGETVIRSELDRLKQTKANCNTPGWLNLCVKASLLTTLQRDLVRLHAAVNELARTHPDEYPATELLDRLKAYEQRLVIQAKENLDPVNAATRQLMAEMPQMQRHMLVELNPLLQNAEICFVKRFTYNSKHYYDDFQHIVRFGGNLYVLSLADDRLREVAPQLAGGVFDRYDISFDAKRIAFGYRRLESKGFHLWEIGVDGHALRQLTYPPVDEDRRIAKYGTSAYPFWTEDIHPCYLPDGGFCFASTRSEHGVLCTPGHYLACTNLFRMNADGSDLRPISAGALSEFTPTILEDGRILYNRWEYVYKGIAAVQSLWITRPDGSGSEEFYGDNIANPAVLWQARQVPGNPRLVVCTGCGHEPLGVGPLLLLDLNKNKRTVEPMVSLTPDVKVENLRGLYQRHNGQWREDIFGPFYADPYPLSDKFFLVSCNPDKRYNDVAAYGIYLLDAFGNRVPIYRDPDISCWQPMLLKPRQRPPVLPSESDRLLADRNSPHDDTTATVFLSNVYEGLDGVEPGTVKYLRVMEQIPKPWAAEVDPLRGNKERYDDGCGGHLAVSKNSHIWIAVLQGIVPVEEDGSACFEVPARRNLFFQALDKDFMEVQRMRTFINFEPGEKRSCIGCHEHRTQAPVSKLAMAFARPALKLSAQPGEIAPRPLHYPTDVQPILDQHCVACHNGSDPKAAPDLRGNLTNLFNRSYENLLAENLVNTIREWAGSSYAMQNAEAVAPYTYGSHRSRLVELLKKGHYGTKLSRKEWIKLVTWIDCGAPYYGSYYGRRHLKYQGQPDFRPTPTLDSARGVPPVFSLAPASNDMTLQ